MTNVRCKNCGFTEDFRFGSGMQHSTLERCMGEFPYWERQKLEEVIGEREIADYNFSFTMAQCQTCLHLMSRPYIGLLFRDGSRYHNELCCSECESDNVRIIHESRIETARCPFCKEKDLEKGPFMGMWD